MTEPPLPPRFLKRADLARTWAFAALIGSACLVSVFAGYEVAERAYFREHLTTETLFALHLARGILASILVGSLSIAIVLWMRTRYERVFATAYLELSKAMEERVAEGERLFAQVKNQEKMAALGVLSAGIAHDIANPLASMSSELEMLEDETDIASVKASLSELRRQVKRIDRTLREMTDFARRRGDCETDVPLHIVIDDALRMVRHDPRARKIQIDMNVPEDLTPLRAVEDHMVMVFVNIMINAFDAMPEGGTLRIDGAAQKEGVVIRVTDSGTGMSEEVRESALVPLFTTKKKGTGLGLSVSASVVEAACGTLTLESTPLGGTTVKLTFPNLRRRLASEPRVAPPRAEMSVL